MESSRPNLVGGSSYSSIQLPVLFWVTPMVDHMQCGIAEYSWSGLSEPYWENTFKCVRYHDWGRGRDNRRSRYCVKKQVFEQSFGIPAACVRPPVAPLTFSRKVFALTDEQMRVRHTEDTRGV